MILVATNHPFKEWGCHRDHTQIERGGRMACWSDFPLQGVHRFESPRLLDMSNRLFMVAIK
jgi:hypothetical protein